MPARPVFDRDLCETCGAAIRWCFTVAGARMPIDPDGDDDGNVYLGPVPGEPRRLAHVDEEMVAACLARDERYPGEVVMPHAATCGGRRPRPRSERPAPPPRLDLDGYRPGELDEG